MGTEYHENEGDEVSDYGVTIHDQGDLARIATLEAEVNARDLCIDAWQRAGEQKDAEIAQAEAALAERDRMLEVAYENADFDEPLTLDKYKADLSEQADARAQYLRARAEK